MALDFIGAGWAFPLRTDATGGVALATREREIEQAIRLVLGTSPGERPMRPEFGSRIGEYVFAPANATTAGQLSYEVRVALERWEPRVDVDDVEVTFDAVDAGVLYLDVRYRIRGSNDPRNLVFPFYTIPDHESLPPVPDDDPSAQHAIAPYSVAQPGVAQPGVAQPSVAQPGVTPRVDGMG